MTRIMLSGCNGRMGQNIAAALKDRGDIRIVAGVDIAAGGRDGFPVYTDPSEYDGECDVVVDFSSPAALDSLLRYCTDKKLPLVLATTGHTDTQLRQIEDVAERIAIFRSANMSLGINLLTELARQTAKLLAGSYDIEIVERHHNQKLDAPSGTALALANAIRAALPFETENVYERQSVHRKRGQNEIGMHAVRGGTIVGEHEIIFAGPDEVIELKHSALSRGVFAGGAIKAAGFMPGRAPGLYGMQDLIAEII